ncbi:hypothetical protein [Pseudolysinimonas sp.]|uniref:hypothetical protein n=1 Tax=Pseudolysinimonas sp. TaxID=2680009 RepID=UPI003F7FDFFC
MTRTIHVIALALATALGLFVGVWAYFFPTGFYDAFPGVLGHWIDIDGPFNEHLIRDVGAMYLALSAASAGALIWRSSVVFRIVGIAWTVFGLLHFAYHVVHLDHGTTEDAIGTVVSLVVSLALGVILLIPARPRSGSRG